MSLRFREEYKVEFGQIDFHEKLTINGVVHYMQQTAGNHAEALNVNYHKSEEKTHYYWIIARAKFILDKYPRWKDKLTVETYPGGYHKLFAVRLFNLLDEEGEKIGHIIGDYILMDSLTNRPVKIKGIKGPLDVLDFPYVGETLDKLAVPSVVQKQELRKVRYSEMDVNHHMNNAQHIRWAVDMLPIDIFKEKEIATLQINYNTGISYGTEVMVKSGVNEDHQRIIWGTSVDGDTNFFTAEITMREV